MKKQEEKFQVSPDPFIPIAKARGFPGFFAKNGIL